METTTKYFVADLVEEIGSLPTIAAQIVGLTSDPDCDIGDLVRVIQSDGVMTMRFLALANSAALRGANESRDLRTALVRLGLRRVRNVSLFMGMHDMNPVDNPDSSLDMKEFWKYTLATASCAQGLAWQKGLKTYEDAWLAGILHGIGICALDQQASPGFQAAVALAGERKISLNAAELLVLDFHSGELGSRILRQWGLPQLFAEVIEFLDEDFGEDEVEAEAQELITTVRQAVTVVRAFGFGDCGDGRPAEPLDKLAEILKIPDPAIEALAAKVDREVLDLSRLVGLDLDGRHFEQTLAESKRQAARLGLEGFENTLAKEKLEEQLALARQIQQHLLPQSQPDQQEYELAAVNYPSLQVSGDYYDFLKMKGGRVGLVIADVCGKGMPASLLASNLQASLRALSQVISDPGELLHSVNNALFESTDPEHFATLFLAVLDPDGTGFRYASAGHNPPLLLTRKGQSSWLKPAGTPLGMFADMQYPVMEVSLDPGDLVAAYTDGITEATDLQDQEFEESGLEAVVRAGIGLSCADLIQRVIDQVMVHVTGKETVLRVGSEQPNGAQPAPEADAGDDLTMMVWRRPA